MKRLLIILLSLLSLTAMAQQKPKVAIYVIGDNPINEIISNRLMFELTNSGKYLPVERSTEFLAAIAKEQKYGQSGEVDERQISKLGLQYGINYICIVSLLDVWGEKYITSRIIDVNSAEVVGACSSSGVLSSSGDLMRILSGLSSKFIHILDYNKEEVTQKVAVYVDKSGNNNIDIALGDQLVAGFSQSRKYIAVERTEAFLKQIKKESGYQKNGTVNDNELIKIGKQFGIQYICAAKVSMFDNKYFISTRMIDVETAQVYRMYNVENREIICLRDIINSAQEIVDKITGVSPSLTSTKDYIEYARGINMKMIWVEGGEFMMGCPPDCRYCVSDGQNIRRTKVDGFYIGAFEISQYQWGKIMGMHNLKEKLYNCSSPHNMMGYDYPIYCISWEEACEFCQMLSMITGKTYVLPSEAQWEYAARGGNQPDGTIYAGSNSLDLVGWYGGNTSMTNPIGSLLPNSLGIYDMSGNMVEWCNDWYGEGYNKNDWHNPTGPSTGKIHVYRGGWWCSDDKNECSVIYREPYYGKYVELGFRVVCIP